MVLHFYPEYRSIILMIFIYFLLSSKTQQHLTIEQFYPYFVETVINGLVVTVVGTYKLEYK